MRIDGKDNKDFHSEHPAQTAAFFSGPSDLPDISFSTNVKAAQKVSYYLWYIINPMIPVSLNEDIHRIYQHH